MLLSSIRMVIVFSSDQWTTRRNRLFQSTHRKVREFVGVLMGFMAIDFCK